VTLTLPAIAAEQVVAFLLVLARVSPLFAIAPIFSARMIPMRAKLLCASAIAFALTPVATGGRPVPTDAVDAGLLMVKEALVGLGFAFAVSVLAGALQVGAGILDAIVGFSYAAIVDPITNMQNAVFGQLYAVFTAAVFLVIGGDQIMIAGLARSYDLVSLGSYPDLDTLGALAAYGFGEVFLVGLQIVAPAVIALLLVDAALGIVAKAVPQANVFVVGLPAKIIVAFGIVGASLPFVARRLGGELESSVATALRAIGI
jgi:flagellar biosynthetic protein FliR